MVPSLRNLKKYTEIVFSRTGSDGRTEALAHLQGKTLRLEGEDALSLLKQAKEKAVPIKALEDRHLVLARGLDLQAHLRFPGQEDRETLEGGLLSALAGGYDSVIAMPNTKPFLDTPDKIQACLGQIEAGGFKEVRVGQTAAATLNMQGLEATDIAELKRAGAVAITDDGWGINSNEIQEKVLRLCASEDLLFMQHAERPDHKGVTPEGPFQQRHGLPAYPDDAEAWMVNRDIELVRKIPKARYHVLHVSTAKTVELIRQAKREGLQVTAEVSPHHLFFCNEDIPDPSHPHSTYFKMNPPLFRASDREAVRAALREGVIDCVATDHAPHSAQDKAKGWVEAAFGTRGLETALSVLCTLCKEGVLSYDRLETYFSTRPREILANPNFSHADGFVIVDKSEEFLVTESDLPGISRNSIFLNQKLSGKIVGLISSEGSYFNN